MAENTVGDSNCVYPNRDMQERWVNAVDYLRNESKCGLAADIKVERILVGSDVYFQGKMRAIELAMTNHNN